MSQLNAASNQLESSQPSTSGAVLSRKTADGPERPNQLMPLRRGNNLPFRRGSHTKNGRIIPAVDPGTGGPTSSRSPSLERACQWQCHVTTTGPSPQGRAWWRRRSVAADDAMSGDTSTSTRPSSSSGDPTATAAHDDAPMSTPTSPASTPASSRSGDFVNALAAEQSGTQSKSSSRSGSSRSAFRIFKPGGSQSNQNSKAQIISCAPFSHSPSIGRTPAQKAGSPAASAASQCAAMRASVAAASASSKSALKLVHVHTLTKQNIVVSVERKCQVWDVFHSCCVHLGIDDDRLFGLALRRPCEGFGGAEDRPRHEYFFLDPEQKISKYVPKEAKHSSSAASAMSSPVSKLKGRARGCGTSSPKPMIVLYMRVRVYVKRIDAISCDVALRHYYLQLRENLIDQWSAGPHSGASEEACWELAALAILTDRGREWRTLANDSGGLPPAGFTFRAEQYFPLWVINARGLDYIQENMPKVLRGYGSAGGPTSAASSLGGGCASNASTSSSSASPPINMAAAFTETDAMFQFCQEASRGPFALNCHLYGLRRQKTDILNNALIGITDKGIDLWDVSAQGERVLLRSLTWSKLSCLSFDSKRITIAGLDGSRLVFYAESESKARYLLAFCREVHQQLLQINTNFVLNRPPSSPLLPPGWGLERLIDASQMRSSLMRRFNSAEYGLPLPTFSPRSDSNPPEISSFNAAVTNHHALLSTGGAKPLAPQNPPVTHQQDDESTSTQAAIEIPKSQSNQASATVNITRTAPAIAKSRPLSREMHEPCVSVANTTSAASKVRRFKKAGYQRRASSPLTTHRTVSSDDVASPTGPAITTPTAELSKRNTVTGEQLVDATAQTTYDQHDGGCDIHDSGSVEQTTSLESAMNNAPSPPKYALHAHLTQHQPADGYKTAASSENSAVPTNTTVTPKSALKRPNSSKQTQIPTTTGFGAVGSIEQAVSVYSPPNSYTTSMLPANYPVPQPQLQPLSSSFGTHHLSYHFNGVSGTQGMTPPPAYVTPSPAMPLALPASAATVVTVTTAKLRPPPQYSEAVEQLRKRNNASNSRQTSVSDDSRDHPLLPLSLQSQHGHVQFQQAVQQHNPHYSSHAQYSVANAIGTELPSASQVQIYAAAAPSNSEDNSDGDVAAKRTIPLNQHTHQRHELASRWKTVSGGIDTDTLTRLQKNYDRRRQAQADSSRKYGSVVESNDTSELRTFTGFQPAISEPKLSAQKEKNGNENHTGYVNGVQPQQSTNSVERMAIKELYLQQQSRGQPHQQIRYASRSPSVSRSLNRISNGVQEECTHDAIHFTSVQQQHPSVILIENQMPYQGHIVPSGGQQLLSKDAKLPPGYGSTLENLAVSQGAAGLWDGNTSTTAPTSEHTKEQSISNTEKFKNYPMMKALWEARHDLAATVARYDNSNAAAGTATENGLPPPPPYAQYIQQQQHPQQKQHVATTKGKIETLSSTFTSAASISQTNPVVNGNGLSSANGGDTAAVSAVMDLPPPPPYPQGAMHSAPRTQAASRKAAVM